MSPPSRRRGGSDRIVVSYLGRDVAEIEPSTAVSENPTFNIPFRATETGPIRVTVFDTPGGKFEGIAEVKVT
ncbi:MAG TPA: thiosulfate oxidation carrier complex protein SoxZ [Methylomirabilota bacterium]|nr:thiosulfate oxidation carrier complex protein SoxZ [Methylomirabilota bacterium]